LVAGAFAGDRGYQWRWAPDLVTGKRYMAHNGHDPGEREPLGIYWYEMLKRDAGPLEWVKHVIDYGGRAGAGCR